MDLRQHYPDFVNFLSCWLADPTDDTLSDAELALDYIQYGIPLQAYNRLLTQSKQLLEEQPFPWEGLAAHSNRIFRDEAYAHQWLEQIVNVFEHNLPK